MKVCCISFSSGAISTSRPAVIRNRLATVCAAEQLGDHLRGLRNVHGVYQQTTLYWLHFALSQLYVPEMFLITCQDARCPIATNRSRWCRGAV